MWVLPEEIGTGLGGKLFLHACEIAETMGAEELNILSDPNSEGFYVHMGAEHAGDTECKEIPGWTQPVLHIKL